jgi:colanic acid/amylovoran biosynthesis glycosyltransferase
MKHIVTYYGYDVNMLPAQDSKWLSRYKELFDEADLFQCQGPHMAEQLVGMGCPESKVAVFHLGVATATIPYEPRHWRPGEPLRVLIAATFREKKGIPYALEALAQLRRVVPVQATIIGDAAWFPSSRQEKQRILEIIQNSGLAPTTTLLGFQPHSVLFEVAYNHHVFISPSVVASDGDDEGGAPIAIIEMIATGMPVVSTVHCDIPEVVRYGVENWLVGERDAAGLLDRLLWLIRHPERWEKMLGAGRRHVEQEYDAVEQGRKLEKTYRELLGDK